MEDNENRIMVREMTGIIIGFGLLLQAALLLFVKDRLRASLGLWVGIALAVFMLVHMYRVLRTAIGEDSKSAKNYVLRHSVIRYLVVAAVFGVVGATRIGDPFACFAGVLALKAAAYLQPVYRRIKEGKKRKTE